MNNVSFSSHLQTQLGSIMELMAKTAISEIIKLFDTSYAALRVEISRNENEKDALKRKLQEVQEELRCVRLRLETSIPPSNCPPPRDQVLPDWATDGQAVTGGVNLEQTLKQEKFLVHVKEEGPLEELWNQEAEPMRYDATVAGNGSAHLSQESIELQYPELKAEPQEVEVAVAQGVSTQDKQTQSNHTRDLSRLAPIDTEEEQGPANGNERFLPFLPQIEEAFGYFHSNPISPEQPEALPSPPPFSGPGTSAETFGLGYGVGYVSPPRPRAGRGLFKRPLVCPVCQKQVLGPSDLTKHMRSHTGERPFPCSICGMHFSLKSSLKTHERLHTGLRPYRCSYCGKDYTLSHHLKRHMRSHFRECTGATQLQMPEQLELQQEQGPQSL